MQARRMPALRLLDQSSRGFGLAVARVQPGVSRTQAEAATQAAVQHLWPGAGRPGNISPLIRLLEGCRAGLTAYVNGPRISTRGSGDVLRRERYRSDAARSISNRCERDNDDTEAAILLTAASSALRSRLESPARGTSYMKTVRTASGSSLSAGD